MPDPSIIKIGFGFHFRSTISEAANRMKATKFSDSRLVEKPFSPHNINIKIVRAADAMSPVTAGRIPLNAP